VDVTTDLTPLSVLSEPATSSVAVVLKRGPSSKLKELMRGHKGKNGKSFNGLKPIRVKLISGELISTSAAATANTINSNVTFSSSTFPEVADFSTVYDECRIVEVKVHYLPYITVAAGTSQVQSASMALAIGFDPSVGNPTTPQGVMEETFSTPPMRLFPGVNNGNLNNSGDCFAQTYKVLKAKPPVALAPITSADCPGAAWFCVDGGTAPIIFQWYGYINALGTSGVTNVAYFYELDVEFRLRT